MLLEDKGAFVLSRAVTAFKLSEREERNLKGIIEL